MVYLKQLIVVLLSAMSQSEVPALEVQPEEALAGEPWSVHVRGLEPGAVVKLTAEQKSESGVLWQSHAFSRQIPMEMSIHRFKLRYREATRVSILQVSSGPCLLYLKQDSGEPFRRA